jgi:hypothetical protein
MIGELELAMYCSEVPWICAYCGGPSKLGVNAGGLASEIVADCGIEFAMSASCACGVPATEASTTPAGESFGIFAKSGGSAFAATKVHGPERPGARYQRPEMRM